MKKITFFICAFLCFGLSIISAQQFDFPAQAGPFNVANGSPVTVAINDAGNSAGVTPALYSSFSVSVDWSNPVGDPYSNEADLTLNTTAGSTLVDPPTTGAAANGNPTTLTFEGDLAGIYDPSTDGFLEIVLNQSWSGSSADWGNIVVTLFEAPACPEPINLSGTVLTTTTAELSWTPGNVETLWDVEVVDLTGGGSATGTPTATDIGNPYTAMGLTEGNDYEFYVRANCGGDLSAWAGPFAWSQNVPPPNNSCAGVIDLGTLSSPLTATTEFATNDFGQDCLTNPGAPDIVYSILVPNGSTIEIGQTSNLYDSKHRLAYGGSCPGDNLIACVDDPDTQTESWTNTTGSDQTVYWVQSAFSTGSGEFTLAWNVFACSPPVATFTVVEDCGVSGGFLIDVDITDLGSATSLTVSDDQMSAPQSVTTTGVVQFGPYANATDVVITVAHDQDGLCDITSGTLTQVACPPSNNDCANAIAVTPGGTFADNPITGQTNAGATGSGELPLPGCASYDPADPTGNGGDLWYAVTVPSDGNLTIETDADPTGGGGDGGMAVYTGSCGALSLFECNDDGGNGLFGQVIIEPADGLADQTVYIRVWEFGGNAIINFQVSAFSATLSTGSFENEAAFTYYPNPVQNTLTLNAQNTIENVAMYNMLGQEVLRVTPNAVNSELDMSNLQDGTYFVKVTIANTTKTIRVVKN